MSEEPVTCVASANVPAPESADGQASPPIVLPSSLVGAMQDLGKAMIQHAHAIDRQNELLIQIVAQNADLISSITNDEEEDEGEHDLLGNRVG